MNKDKLVIIAGPTAIGKSKISVELAKRTDGEIISADSMQVYRGMDIGTAKITETEKDGVIHHMIDILDPTEEFNVVSFAEIAKKKIKEIQGRGHMPIVCGGTGFYIQALLYDVDFTENSDDRTYRDGLMKLAEEKGNLYLHEMLREKDPESAERIHPNNLKRVIRALEFYNECHLKISEHNDREREKRSPYDHLYFALTDEREAIYDRINKRVDQMLGDGLLNEVDGLLKKGVGRDSISMQGLGYKEIASYLCGEISYDEAVFIIKRDTRHFAKRQLTWLKREKDVIWFDRACMNENEIIDKMISMISE